MARSETSMLAIAMLLLIVASLAAATALGLAAYESRSASSHAEVRPQRESRATGLTQRGARTGYLTLAGRQADACQGVVPQSGLSIPRRARTHDRPRERRSDLARTDRTEDSTLL